jgi:hypothetical protein
MGARPYLERIGTRQVGQKTCVVGDPSLEWLPTGPATVAPLSWTLARSHLLDGRTPIPADFTPGDAAGLGAGLEPAAES